MSEVETNQDAIADEAVGEQTSEDQKYAPDELEAEAPVATKPRDDVNLDLILDVSVSLALRVGSTNISIRQLVNLAEGSVVALDRLASEPLDVLANGTLVAHGEIVVVNGNFGVRLTDVVSPAERIETLN
ncbi:MAG: flagellar motor switch protein FliN [Woeseiaceae bacterium]